MAPRNVEEMSSTITLVSIVLFATLCASRLSLVEANYYYHAGTNTNSYHHSKASGHYSSGMSPHHQIMHHKHHQHHGHNGRLQQAAVGVVNRGRLLPLTATAATTPPPTTLSPLDRLMSKLDSWDKQAVYDSNKRNHENLHHANARRHDPVSPGLLRSSDRRYAHMKTRIEDSYEDGDDDDEDDDDDDDEDDEDTIDEFDGNKDEDDEDEDEGESGFSRFTGGRHQHPHRSHSSHRNGHTSKEDPLFDSVVADFPDHPSGSATSGTMSDGASGARGASYSDYKWRVLNKDNMDILRNQRRGGSVIYRAESPETQPYYINKLVEHNSELTKFGSCRIPRPKVIKVSDEYPHPSKTYFPHCTILHRCSDDTGCCSSDSSTCAALKMEQVERFFYTKVFGAPQPKIVVEKLTFQNHTACTCLDTQQEMMPRDRPFSSSEHDTPGRSNFRGHYRPDIESAKTVSGSKGGTSCRCTSQFSPRHVADGSCACECFDKQRECLRLKRGKDFLTHEDRICILRGDCMSPSCEFGTYLRKQGRCPRKSEKFDAWQTYPLHDEEYQ